MNKPSTAELLRTSRVPEKRVLAIGDCRAIIRKVWLLTIVGNVLGKCHAPFTTKTSFVDFEKE
jgi:hypothetical protein